MKHPHIYREVRCGFCDRLLGYFCYFCNHYQPFRPILTIGSDHGVCAGCNRKINPVENVERVA